MPRFTISKLSLFRGEEINSKYNFELCIVDHENTEIVNGTTQLKQIKVTVEDFFELAFVVKEFADILKAEEKAKLQQHIQALEERLADSRNSLKQIEEM